MPSAGRKQPAAAPTGTGKRDVDELARLDRNFAEAEQAHVDASQSMVRAFNAVTEAFNSATVRHQQAIARGETGEAERAHFQALIQRKNALMGIQKGIAAAVKKWNLDV